MKKKLLTIATLGIAALTLAACGSSNDTDTASTGSSASGELETLIVGASPSPHAEILEHVMPLLEEKGIKLEIKEFTDYVLPDTTLVAGDIDANYFAHTPFINAFNAENNDALGIAGAVHVEPLGAYSKRYDDIADLPDGATVLTSTNTPDYGRILTILIAADLVTVKDGVDLETATFDDIDENPKNLTFKTDIAPELLTSAYDNDEGDLIFINANFAYQSGLNPVEDSILLEGDDSLYANVIAVRKGEEEDSRIVKLLEVLHEKEVQDWILEKWDGSVKPVSE
ncbi:MetQ/NlpA family ABC transporter substrate-binding protein [Enterococcus timonensis]|uniref:MetQ/NlpA family ABC transporter substrate-binding protein n=1 Tax=Enterococcus timonensis TaxID=1852364 RepID=UPI0008DA4C55|nr:MetQ/NlpA family ABC transporter substrate-binding protein [Enterococcus timonensis]